MQTIYSGRFTLYPIKPTFVIEMNRIDKLFQEKQNNILAVYFTAGYPGLGDTTKVLRSLADSGADIIEVGIPYSDPVADGPTIQASGQQALDNGMNLKLLLEQLADIRQHTQTPIVLMGYFNTVLVYGVERFCMKCKEVGVDGLILPDLPVEEYKEKYADMFAEYGLCNILLISPTTKEERIRQIDEISTGFLYMVSSNAITGAKGSVEDAQEEYFKRIEAMNLKTPRLIGFGISNRQTFERASKYASGAIIGSAFVNLLTENEKDFDGPIREFVKEVKGL
ncbi:tryptophan synthase alpha chain [Fulvitalea axinellae]|uniref:Tryptophan synthase alpha chain n=1 Tax=Fulvitalea axinellae TaxID=1182444 RepID=A0AAU9CKK3_9BACT|nr:tryptophan synthase alpha chain [Fulvitalea axinellae]